SPAQGLRSGASGPGLGGAGGRNRGGGAGAGHGGARPARRTPSGIPAGGAPAGRAAVDRGRDRLAPQPARPGRAQRRHTGGAAGRRCSGRRPVGGGAGGGAEGPRRGPARAAASLRRARSSPVRAGEAGRVPRSGQRAVSLAGRGDRSRPGGPEKAAVSGRFQVMVPAPPEQLRGLPLFAGIPEKARDKVIEKVRKYVHVVRFQPGEVVLREGDYSDSAYCIVEGAVEVVLAAAPSEAEKPRVRGGAHVPPGERPGARPAAEGMVGRGRGTAGTVILSAFPADVAPGQRTILEAGEIFGEIGALSRYPVS